MLVERYLPRTIGGQPLITCITHLFLSLDSVSLGVANQCAYADDMPMSTRNRAHAELLNCSSSRNFGQQIWREDAGRQFGEMYGKEFAIETSFAENKRGKRVKYLTSGAIFAFSSSALFLFSLARSTRGRSTCTCTYIYFHFRINPARTRRSQWGFLHNYYIAPICSTIPNELEARTQGM